MDLFTIMTAASLMLASITAVPTKTYERTAFYFSAHPDDWQLFMNPHAYKDVASKETKVVFIHTTAGDAGFGTNDDGREHAYFEARENGAEAAVRFMVDVRAMPQPTHRRRVFVRDKLLFRVEYGNAVVYFLRLPDGHPRGVGYERTGLQSLERLMTGDIEQMDAIDGSTSYHGWLDVVATMREIIVSESNGTPIDVHVAERDRSLNPDDHSDHYATAALALEATNHLACVRRFHHVGYHVSRLRENLSQSDAQIQTAVFAVTAAGITAHGLWTPWDNDHRQWLGRSYFRVEQRNECPD